MSNPKVNVDCVPHNSDVDECVESTSMGPIKTKKQTVRSIPYPVGNKKTEMPKQQYSLDSKSEMCDVEISQVAFGEDDVCPLPTNNGIDAAIDLIFWPSPIEPQSVTINVGDSFNFNTGIRFSFSPRWRGIIKERSSMALEGIIVRGGVIDSGYTAQPKIMISRLKTEFTEPITINKGDAIAQMMFCANPILTFKVLETTQMYKPIIMGVQNDVQFTWNTRGNKGFGSTGKSGNTVPLNKCPENVSRPNLVKETDKPTSADCEKVVDFISSENYSQLISKLI